MGNEIPVLYLCPMNQPPWENNRRYNSYLDYFKKAYGFRVQKVTLDVGFTCPNRDGSKGFGGCTYCNNDSFNPSYCNPKKSVTQQLDEGVEFHKTRYKRAPHYLAYFQAYSNTYGALEKLKKLYEEALAYPDVVGLAIGTRPDCIDDEKLEYIARLAEEKYVIIEYGIESCYNKTLEKVNRGHTFEETAEAFEKTAHYGIKTGAHVMFGLPGESREEMLAEASILSKLPINNIKFHQLQIIAKTAMASHFAKRPEDFALFTLEEYAAFMVRFVEKLNPNFVIERFAAESPPRYYAGPRWKARSHAVQELIESKMEAENTWQGKFYAPH